MAFTNPREKHPSTQKAYMAMQVATHVGTGVQADIIAAPGAGLCINVWAFSAFSNHTGIEAWGIGDGVATPISVAATKNTSLNISLPMPVIFGENLGVDILDTHSVIGSASKATTLYYTIVPV